MYSIGYGLATIEAGYGDLKNMLTLEHALSFSRRTIAYTSALVTKIVRSSAITNRY